MTPQPAPQRLLLNPDLLPDASDTSWILQGGLGGIMAERLPSGHPLRALLEHQGLSLLARHLRARRELIPLLQLWAERGLAALIIKGFALAEFVYQHPGQRFYSDVDILISPDSQRIHQAVELAEGLGWKSDGFHEQPETWTHETAHLTSPQGLRIDVHRWAVSAVPPLHNVPLTTALWRRAEVRYLEGTPVYVLPPAEALCLLSAHRSWGGDAGELKAADWTDTALLLERTTPAAVRQTASELGLPHTWNAFEQALRQTSREVARLLLLQARREDGVQSSAGFLNRVRLASWKGTVQRSPRYVRDLWHAHRCYQAGRDPRPTLATWEASSAGTMTEAEVTNAVIDLRRLTRVLYPRQAQRGLCLPRALVIYRVLRRRGYPAVFVSGIAASGQGVAGHAWVESPGEHSLPAYGEPLNRARFRELFRYPPAPEPAPSAANAADT